MTKQADWQKGTAAWPFLVPELDFPPATTALLIVDMQNCFAHPDYGVAKILAPYPHLTSYYYERIRNTVMPNNIRLLEFFRKHGLRVIFITLGSRVPDYSDLTSRRIKREAEKEQSTSGRSVYYRNAFEAQVVSELKPRETELMLLKTSGGAFNSTSIHQNLINLGIKGLVISGVATNACVETTARDAADRGYNCILVEDACAAFDVASHNATLLSFSRLYGNVKSTAEVISQLGKGLST